LESNEDGTFRVAPRVAKDRIITTVDRRPGTATRPEHADSTDKKAMSQPTGQRDHHRY